MRGGPVYPSIDRHQYAVSLRGNCLFFPVFGGVGAFVLSVLELSLRGLRELVLRVLEGVAFHLRRKKIPQAVAGAGCTYNKV